MDLATTAARSRPGALVVWSGAAPWVQLYELPEGGLVMGRDLIGADLDERISRQHARIESTLDGGFLVVDLGSRNGTFVGGQPVIDREVMVTGTAVVRTGRTVFVLVPDIEPFMTPPVGRVQDVWIGPSSATAWWAIAAAVQEASHLCIFGEVGSQKGHLARAYASSRGLPEALYDPTVHAVPINRVLKMDTQTLVLENVSRRLTPHASELMRLLEDRPELRVCSTSEAPLGSYGLPDLLVAALGQREVSLRPLRDRPDELAYLAFDAAKSAEAALEIHASLIETCLLRPWPQNARELTTAVARAANAVAASGKSTIRGEDLDNTAGRLMMGAPTMNVAAQSTAMGLRRRRNTLDED